jgi:hypothetical protein
MVVGAGNSEEGSLSHRHGGQELSAKELHYLWTLLLTSIHTAAVSEEGPKVAKFLDR